MASLTPTQRSLAYLRENGYLVEIVEHWNPWVKQRKDLWGWCDLLAIKRDKVLAVQVTASGASARVKKIQASDTIARVREAGITVHVHSWRKLSDGKYHLRVVDIS